MFLFSSRISFDHLFSPFKQWLHFLSINLQSSFGRNQFIDSIQTYIKCMCALECLIYCQIKKKIEFKSEHDQKRNPKIDTRNVVGSWRLTNTFERCSHRPSTTIRTMWNQSERIQETATIGKAIRLFVHFISYCWIFFIELRLFSTD